MLILHKKNRLKLLIVNIIIAMSVLIAGASHVEAFTFNFTQMMQIKTPPSTFNLIKKIQFSQLFADLLVTNKLVNVRFSPVAFRKNFGECKDAVILCQKEFDSCKGTIDQFDQAGYELLEKANIQCQNSCEAPTIKCFGLFDNNISLEQPEPEPEQLQCTGPETRSCNTATGQPGTQTARSCNTTTGEWNFGLCVAEFTPPPPPPPPPPPECDPNQPQCQPGYAGGYQCLNGQWVNNCYLPTCQGSAPSCPAGYSGFYVCQNSQWVSQCQAPTCSSWNYSAWGACVNGVQTRSVTQSFPEGCTGGYPVTSQSCSSVCTSFTYSAWSTCSGGSQSRTVLASSPSGCTGGNPILSQTCCDGAKPACPANWTGSYTCANNYWYPTCVPPGSPGCYRGAKYILYNNVPYASCVGNSVPDNANGQSCNRIINQCTYDIWNSFTSESIFRAYVDTMYGDTIPKSCDPSFAYTQC